MSQTIIFGAGALGRELYEYLGLRVTGANVVFVDDAATPDQRLYGNPVVDRLRTPPDPLAQIFVAIASPDARRRVTEAVIAGGLRPTCYQHKTSTRVIGRTAREIEMLMPYTLVSCNCAIESGLFMNSYASVGHDCTIGKYCTLGPYVGITGGVTIGDHVTIGAGAIVLPGVRIGDGAYVGAGSIVLRDVEPGARVFGNPARLAGRAQ